MSETMVERVARAICVSEKINDDDALGGWIHWQEAARAAIEAMREPTDAMLIASYDAERTYGRCDNKRELARQMFRPAWRAAIDDALK